MKPNRRTAVIVTIATMFIVFSSFSSVFAEEYDAMKGVDTAEVVFDMRDGIPEIAAVHMDLIHETYKEFKAMNKNPIFVVVFIASSVKLISSDRSAFSAEDRKYLEQIDDRISKMLKDGIQLEVCVAAVDYFGVDRKSIRPEIKQVGNGWISLVGYQDRGYRLVPVY